MAEVDLFNLRQRCALLSLMFDDDNPTHHLSVHLDDRIFVSARRRSIIFDKSFFRACWRKK
jgi:hypothetical protein